MHRPTAIAAIAAALTVPLAAQNLGASFSATVDGYIEVPYSPQVVPASGLTFEAWITYDDSTLPTGWRYPTVARQGISVGGSENWFLRINADNVGARRLRWKIVTAAGGAPQVDWLFAPGQLNTWTHVAGTWDGTTAVLYINGASVGTATGTGPIRDIGNEVLRIGKGSDVATPIEVWNGSIDEVRLWPFARTGAEIMASMNQTLAGVPGRVSTWSLDGHVLDTSGGLNGTTSGQVTFTSNPLTLSGAVMPAAVGTGTPGCLGPIQLAPTGAAQLGNQAFAIAVTQTPSSTIAVFGLSAGTLPGPLPLLGVDIWLDPTGLVTATAIASSLGTVRLPIPIPAGAPLGFSFGAQAIIVDACGSQQFTSSDALSITLQP
jgi:Concanavalin A-like lectin/glucanases superfamily